MVEALENIPPRKTIPSERVIEQKGCPVEDFNGFPLHSIRIKSTSYIIEGVGYNPLKDSLTYEVLNDGGEWESHVILGERARQMFSPYFKNGNGKKQP